jgi:hypothetical protein
VRNTLPGALIIVGLLVAGAAAGETVRMVGPNLLAAAEVMASGDKLPPTISIISPKNGETVSGDTTITAQASDNVKVVGVQFKVGMTDIGPEDTSAPFKVTFDASVFSIGTRTVQAVARDAAGNHATSTISINVACTQAHPCEPPSPTPFLPIPDVYTAMCYQKHIKTTFHVDTTCTPYTIGWGDTATTSYVPKKCTPILYNLNEGPTVEHTYAKSGLYTIHLSAGTKGKTDYIDVTAKDMRVGSCEPSE